MVSFSAAGKMCPPMIVFPYKSRIPGDITRSVPDGWGIGHSESGWMQKELFYEYVANVFHPFLIKEKIKMPVILFVDGHRSYLTLKLSNLCEEKKIILVALYPNATRILQPCDVGLFKPLKTSWKRAVLHWQL